MLNDTFGVLAGKQMWMWDLDDTAYCMLDGGSLQLKADKASSVPAAQRQQLQAWRDELDEKLGQQLDDDMQQHDPTAVLQQLRTQMQCGLYQALLLIVQEAAAAGVKAGDGWTPERMAATERALDAAVVTALGAQAAAALRLTFKYR
jgi:hypothetical protein